jgi:diguanylate cyclase (GGDEF)-like protein
MFALLYLDLDRFKAINDSLGHHIGDELLVGAARRLERCLRPGDTLARLGGDEFTILLDEISCAADATGVAERIREELTAPFTLRGHEVFTSVSIGIALSSEGYDSPDQMLRDADIAMYRAKAAGHARHEVFDARMHEQAASLLQLETELRRALDRREIVPHYQVIVDLDDERVVGFEALARWQHPSRGTVLPAEFLPLAEETGLMGAIDEWMLAEACRQARAWERMSPSGAALGMSVNISVRHLPAGAASASVERAVGATGMDPARLTLDISESALMHDVDTGAQVLEGLHAMSVGLHLDDFGTGSSSLAYLHGLPVQALKIDRSFVSRMHSTPQQLAIVKAIVSLARNLGLDVVAEGIETRAQADALRALGCRRGQGWLFSKALTAEAAERLLASQRSR